MYEKDGEKYFIVDSHSHFWDASRENWREGREQYAKGWIDCFYGYHQLAPPETHWDYEHFLKVTPEDFEQDVFVDGHVDQVIFQSTYLYDWYTEGFNTADQNSSTARAVWFCSSRNFATDRLSSAGSETSRRTARAILNRSPRER